MAYTIYEYNRVAGDGTLAVEPANKITAAQVAGAAVNLDPGTKLLKIFPAVAMHLAFGSNNTIVATANDIPLAANTVNAFVVKASSNNWIYGV